MKRIALLLSLVLCTLGISAQTNYDYDKIQKENLGRGVIAVRQSQSEVFVAWRYLNTDPQNVAFNVYRDGQLITPSPIKNVTWFVDETPAKGTSTYEVKPTSANLASGSYTLPADSPVGYLPIALDTPAPQTMPDGEVAKYTPGDCSVGDADGDGEIIIGTKAIPIPLSKEYMIEQQNLILRLIIKMSYIDSITKQ